jgi:hypothetical protein
MMTTPLRHGTPAAAKQIPHGTLSAFCGSTATDFETAFAFRFAVAAAAMA